VQSEVSFGSYLRRLRVERGLSQEALAERAGLASTTIASLEAGRRRRLYPSTLSALAEALSIPPYDRPRLLELAHASSEKGASHPATTSLPLTSPHLSLRARVPVPPTQLIGRAELVATVAAQLDPLRTNVRLLTLIGTGGVGKTRVAIAAASMLREAYPDGVAFIDLAPVREMRLVPATLARALDLQESSGRSARELLLDHLREKQLLLILDNFEHLLDAASLVAELLGTCAHVRLLVTSRTALRLRSEHRLPVLPLPAPDSQSKSVVTIAASPAVALFADRAQAVTPEFRLDSTNAAVVGAICRRLDGIPLAIELAAARTNTLEPQALVSMLRRRLPLLSGGAPDLPPRQRTLRGTIAWSEALLEPSDRVLFRRLAVFAGGWTIDAVEAVCTGPDSTSVEVLSGLGRLFDSSLIQRTHSADQRPRFSMLETVREYALERQAEAGEVSAVNRRHLEWSLRLVQPVTPDPPDSRRIPVLAAEYDNLRAALRHAADTGAVEHGLWLAVALTTLWYVLGAYGEGRGWLGELLALPAADAPTLARAYALGADGQLAYCQGGYAAAQQRLDQAHVLARQLGDELAEAVVVGFQANVARRRGELERAMTLYEHSLRQFERLRHTTWRATVLSQMAMVASELGEMERAATLAHESLELFEASDNGWGRSFALRILGRVAARRGDRAAAQALHETSLRLYAEIGATRDRALSLVSLANDVLRQEDAGAARQAYLESLTLADQACDRLTLAHSLEGLASLYSAEQPAIAVRIAGAADAMRTSLGAAITREELGLRQGWLDAARQSLGDAAFAVAWQAGQQLDAAHAVEEVLDGSTSPEV